MQVDFHLISIDVPGYVRRLVAKAVRQTPSLCITGEEQQLRSLSRTLWQTAPVEFLAHATDWDGPEVQALSSVRLCQDARSVPVRDVLINVGGDDIEAYLHHRRIIEIIDASQPAQIQQARVRWRQYQAQGCQLQRHTQAPKNL